MAANRKPRPVIPPPKPPEIYIPSLLTQDDIHALTAAVRALTATIVDERRVLSDQLFIQRESLRVQQEQLKATEALHKALIAKFGNGHDHEPLSSTV